MARLKPQYDAYGFDTGLWTLFSDPEDYDEPFFECLTLFMRDNVLIVGQFQDWDYETYDEDGHIKAEHTELGEFVCRNPYEDDKAAERLLGWLMANDKAVQFA